VVPISSPKSLPDLLRRHDLPLPARLGMELDVVPANLFFAYQAIFPAARIEDISPLIRLQRAVKSPHEIACMQRAAALADRVAAGVPALLREGISEVELAGAVEALARRLGHQGLVRMRLWGSELFYGHLMAGAAAGVPSFLQSPTGGAGLSPAVAQGASRRPIGRHEPVLVDYVFVLDGYIADHTRIFALGDLPAELRDGHRAMLEIEAQLQAAGRPGSRAGDLYETALASATERGYADSFMGAAEPRIRFVGHGVGLELDEYPFIAHGQDLLLEEGMTVALEPKLVFPGRGVVGIENTHVVTADGLRPLTRFPGEIVVL
jgi:Xaa-Pro aminopeptidase